MGDSMKKPQMVFHGTSERSWKKPGKGDDILYLVGDPGEAASYAYEEAARDEEDGYAPKPIVLAIRIDALRGLQFGPDWGWSEATEESTWKDSMKAVGSFTVQGKVENYKGLFVRIPKREWPHE